VNDVVVARADQVIAVPLSQRAWTVAPVGTADLEISLAPHGQPAVGSPVTYYAIVTNHGPAATSVGVELSIAGQVIVDYVSNGTPPDPQCGLTGSLVSCGISTLASGGQTAIVLVLRPTAVGPITVDARITASGASDPNPGNNRATSTVTVAPGS
jgi:hypothetical protein